MSDLPELTPEERAIYEWQMWVPGFGETAQRQLKSATVLISRVGGVGGLVAAQLAMAGVGRLVLAMGGHVQARDLNRQILQTHDRLGQPRLDSILAHLRGLNPRTELIGVPANISDANAHELVGRADIVVDAAPLFEERYAMNRAAVALGKPMVECAMYALEAQLTTFLPGRTGCLACLYPEPSQEWRREFPVLGAVSGTVACLGAVEVVKLITGLGAPLFDTLLTMDLGAMQFRRHAIRRRGDCPVCGAGASISVAESQASAAPGHAERTKLSS